jgi:hypothetical protein
VVWDIGWRVIWSIVMYLVRSTNVAHRVRNNGLRPTCARSMHLLAMVHLLATGTFCNSGRSYAMTRIIIQHSAMWLWLVMLTRVQVCV